MINNYALPFMGPVEYLAKTGTILPVKQGTVQLTGSSSRCLNKIYSLK